MKKSLINFKTSTLIKRNMYYTVVKKLENKNLSS